MKASILNITIDTPEGKLTLTKEEARELYNTLHELFGKQEPTRLPPFDPGQRGIQQPIVPNDWPKPHPVWCGSYPQDTPTGL